jgi:hypothetical protein
MDGGLPKNKIKIIIIFKVENEIKFLLEFVLKD